jgi:hypothetical protein
MNKNQRSVRQDSMHSVSQEPIIEESENTRFLRCLRCGRKLTNPTAQQIGYGPKCEKKMRIPVIEKRRLLF